MSQPFDPRPWTPPMIQHIEDHDRCAVFAAMGAGKTAATLTALDNLALIDPPGKSLVLAPRLVAKGTWPNELAKWDHLAGKKASAITGSEAQRLRALRDDSADIYTINYENIPWLVGKLKSDWPFQTIVADELTKLKGFRLRQGGQRAGELGRVAWGGRVRRFVGLTGTPAPNGLQDLWGQIWFLDKGARLGLNYGAFERRWFVKGWDGYSTEPQPFAQEQIQSAISDIALTIDPKDYISIDEPIVTRVQVTLEGRAKSAYREMEKKMFIDLAEQGLGHGEVEAVNAAAKTQKCLQLASGFLFTDASASQWEDVHDAKLEALERIIDEANGMPIVVAYHFRPDLARLKKRFPHGKTLDELGPNAEAEWNSGRHKLLFGHPASMGHGLSLQDAGNILVFYGMWWDLEQHLQVIERIGPLRQMQAGHPRAVFLYYIIAEGTVDELTYERYMSKRSVQDILLDAMRARN